jgi:hypothetical protein
VPPEEGSVGGEVPARTFSIPPAPEEDLDRPHWVPDDEDLPRAARGSDDDDF